MPLSALKMALVRHSVRRTPASPSAAHQFSYLGLALALFVYASYLLFYSGVFHSSDAKFIVAATESMVKRADFTTAQLWWHQDAIETVAPDGEPYSKYGIGPTLIAAPFYALALAWPALGMVQAVMLANLVVTALTALLLFKLAVAFGYRTGVALAIVLCFALGTSAMVYAHYYFTEPLSALGLTGSFLALYLYRARRQERYAWLAGLAASLAISTKLINALFLLPLFVYAVAICSNWLADSRSRLPVLARTWFPLLAPVALTLAALGAYNALRFGSPLASGYPAWERFDYPLLAGLWGLVLSSEKGLLVYNPILVASLAAFARFGRRHSPEALAILAMAALHLVTYAGWHDWRGGVAWGPRFLVPMLPLLVLPLAAWLAELLPAEDSAGPGLAGRQPITRWAAWVGILALAALSVGVQVVGSGVSFLFYEERYGQMAEELGPALYRLGQDWPVLGHALLFSPPNWDAAWAQASGRAGAIDWPSLVALVGLLLLAGGGLALACRRQAPRGWPGWYPLAIAVLAAGVSLLLLVRSGRDYRFGGGDDYLALLQALQTRSRPGDLVLLGNHIYTDFFFNHNRSLPRWYALDRQAGASDRTLGLLARSAQRYRRMWLVTDLSPDLAERPVEGWLTQHAYKVEEASFSPYARLLQYDTAAGAQTAGQAVSARFGESIELSAFDLAFSTPADPVRLTLTWRALQPTAQDLTVFVQMLDVGGRLAWQVNRYPVDGFRPTSSWRAGEVIVDRYGWQLPPELAPGDYQLIAGLYDWRTGKRLPIADARGAPLGDYLVLGSLSVPAPAGD